MTDFKLTVERSTAYQSGQQPQVTYNVIGSHADILEDLSIEKFLRFYHKPFAEVKNFPHLCIAKSHVFISGSRDAQQCLGFFYAQIQAIAAAISTHNSSSEKSCGLATGNVQPFFCAYNAKPHVL